MLTELRIQNFAIIEDLTLEIGEGLVIFTGETGAGKSIIVDAVETMLGVRADTSLIREGDDRASVEGTFSIPEDIREQVHTILGREEMLDDPNFLVMQREFRREGRNIARVNGRTANLSLVRELGELLIDLHGQSEHLSLLRVPSHRLLLDRYAADEKEVAEYKDAYKALQQLRKELADLKQLENEAAQKVELLTFQVSEINAAKFQPGEEASLKEERTRLANAEALAENVNLALAALDGGEAGAPGAADRAGEALQALRSLAKVDAAQAHLEKSAQNLSDEMTELTRDLRAYLEDIEFNPNRLEEVEERLAMLQSFKRKYGEDILAILLHAEKSAKELENITHAEQRLQELNDKEEELLKDLGTKAQALSEKRHKAADTLAASIEQQLDDLRMEAARFGVDFQIQEAEGGLPLGESLLSFDANGHERIEFKVAPNPGEGLKSLVKVASGGETARLMLAMKNVLANADHTPTLIFDEIDQGIGGRVGAVVGEKLWHLARQHQVFCVTHLPQLAAFGDQHFKVEKHVNAGRTSTTVQNLAGEARLLELATMLGDVSEGTLQSANELMSSVHQTTAAAKSL